jgi:hypothetical protein
MLLRLACVLSGLGWRGLGAPADWQGAAAEGRGGARGSAEAEATEGATSEGGVNRRGILLAVGRRGESHKAVVARSAARWTSSRGPRDKWPALAWWPMFTSRRKPAVRLGLPSLSVSL